MGINLVTISAVIGFAMFLLVLVAIFKRSWKYTKYSWLAVAVLGTVKLVLDLYVGADNFQHFLNLVLAMIAIWNTYSFWKPRKAD